MSIRENKSIVSRTLENRVGVCYVCFWCLDMIVQSRHIGDGWHICCWITGFCDSLNYVSHWGRVPSSRYLISLKSSRWPRWLTPYFQHWEAEAEGLPQIWSQSGVQCDTVSKNERATETLELWSQGHVKDVMVTFSDGDLSLGRMDLWVMLRLVISKCMQLWNCIFWCGFLRLAFVL